MSSYLKSKGSKTVFFVATFVLNLLGVLGIIVILSNNFSNSNSNSNTPNSIQTPVSLASNEVVTKISQLILVPSDEEPRVATINDVETLKKQNAEFYKNAEKDDLIVLYKTRVIIYRPSTDKIINVAPVVN